MLIDFKSGTRDSNPRLQPWQIVRRLNLLNIGVHLAGDYVQERWMHNSGLTRVLLQNLIDARATALQQDIEKLKSIGDIVRIILGGSTNRFVNTDKGGEMHH